LPGAERSGKAPLRGRAREACSEVTPAILRPSHLHTPYAGHAVVTLLHILTERSRNMTTLQRLGVACAYLNVGMFVTSFLMQTLAGLVTIAVFIVGFLGLLN